MEWWETSPLKGTGAATKSPLVGLSSYIGEAAVFTTPEPTRRGSAVAMAEQHLHARLSALLSHSAEVTRASIHAADWTSIVRRSISGRGALRPERDGAPG